MIFACFCYVYQLASAKASTLHDCTNSLHRMTPNRIFGSCSRRVYSNGLPQHLTPLRVRLLQVLLMFFHRTSSRCRDTTTQEDRAWSGRAKQWSKWLVEGLFPGSPSRKPSTATEQTCSSTPLAGTEKPYVTHVLGIWTAWDPFFPTRAQPTYCTYGDENMGTILPAREGTGILNAISWYIYIYIVI